MASVTAISTAVLTIKRFTNTPAIPDKVACDQKAAVRARSGSSGRTGEA